MTKSYSVYRIARDMAGMKGEEAAFLLGLSAASTLYNYEATGRIPRDVVAAMAVLYNAPVLLQAFCNECPIKCARGQMRKRKSACYPPGLRKSPAACKPTRPRRLHLVTV